MLHHTAQGAAKLPDVKVWGLKKWDADTTCSSHGTCQADGKCLCDNGFFLDDCSSMYLLIFIWLFMDKGL